MKIKDSQKIVGYSLKPRKLKHWIYVNNYTMKEIAQKLNISLNEFKRKLKEHECFDEKQISDLVYFVGAKIAFNIIYFSTVKEKRRVYKKTFKKSSKGVR